MSKELAVKMYGNMVTLQMMDVVFYEAQRQGRISFYMNTTGEEAINIASAAALTFDDLVQPQVLHLCLSSSLSLKLTIFTLHICTHILYLYILFFL